MTTQEFIISEAEKYVDNSKPVENDECSWQVVDESFSDGLTKGLEIAKEFKEWASEKYVIFKTSDWYLWAEFNESGSEESYTTFTTSELLTIFLTEKYGNNG